MQAAMTQITSTQTVLWLCVPATRQDQNASNVTDQPITRDIRDMTRIAADRRVSLSGIIIVLIN